MRDAVKYDGKTQENRQLTMPPTSLRRPVFFNQFHREFVIISDSCIHLTEIHIRIHAGTDQTSQQPNEHVTLFPHLAEESDHMTKLDLCERRAPNQLRNRQASNVKNESCRKFDHNRISRTVCREEENKFGNGAISAGYTPSASCCTHTQDIVRE